jgi:hypothetical protein
LPSTQIFGILRSLSPASKCNRRTSLSARRGQPQAPSTAYQSTRMLATGCLRNGRLSPRRSLPQRGVSRSDRSGNRVFLGSQACQPGIWERATQAVHRNQLQAIYSRDLCYIHSEELIGFGPQIECGVWITGLLPPLSSGAIALAVRRQRFLSWVDPRCELGQQTFISIS